VKKECAACKLMGAPPSGPLLVPPARLLLHAKGPAEPTPCLLPVAGAQAFNLTDIVFNPDIFCTSDSSGCGCSVCKVCGTFPFTKKQRCLECAPGWRLNLLKGVCIK
jgi:hypothetical protein